MKSVAEQSDRRLTLYGIGVFLVVSTLSSIGCFSVELENFDEDKRIALDYVQRFHLFFNEQRYDRLYEMFSPKGRESKESAAFTQMLKEFRETTGSAVESKLISSRVSKAGSQTRVRMYFETRFDNAVKFEEFDCLVSGEAAVIDFYGLPEQIPK